MFDFLSSLKYNTNEEVIKVCSPCTIKSLLIDTEVEMRSIFGNNLRDVKLYGSYARGEQTDESDVDVFVLVDMPKSKLNSYRRRVSDISSELDLKYGTLLSIKLQDTDTFYRYNKTLPFFKNVVSEGQSVV